VFGIPNEGHHPLSDHFALMGIETAVFIQNIGRITFLIIAIPFFYLLVYLSRQFTKGSKLKQFIQKNFYHAFTIRLFLESCLDFSLFSTLAFASSEGWVHYKGSYFLAVFCGGGTLLMPFTIVWFLIKREGSLKESSFKLKYGSFYADLRTS